MTCNEFQEILPDMIDGEAAGEHAKHLQACPSCSSLVLDIKAICNTARRLELAEPSPRVWANIQRALEAEGLVRTPRQPGGVLIPRRQWSPLAWVAPLAALLLLGGLLLTITRRQVPTDLAKVESSPAPLVTSPQTSAATSPDADDQQLIAQLAPPLRETYADNLKRVNASIQDAQQSLAQNPGDDEARHFLRDAYEQKAMVYELAMSRSMQ